MKVVHLTDLHVQIPPGAGDLFGKRLLGSANLYLLGRREHFSAAAQAAAVATARSLEPDLLLITGDLTAQALDAEFEAARALLDPLIHQVPTVILAGNHDTYVREPAPAARMRRWFGAWMAETSPFLRVFGEVAVLGLETCRAHLLSSGFADPAQIAAARALLAGLPEPRPFVFLALHYPLRGRDGAPYGPFTRALSNAAQIEAWLAAEQRIDAIVHGHEHHGFRTTLPTGRGLIPVFDPGASGYAFRPEQDRTAHLNAYEVRRDGIQALRRLRFDGTAFADEPGGPYATGR